MNKFENTGGEIPKKSSEVGPDGLTDYQRELATERVPMDEKPADLDMTAEEWSVATPEVIEKKAGELRLLLEKFGDEHSLEALTAITELSPEDAPNHPIREPARNALIPITNILNPLERKVFEHKFSAERYSELQWQYHRLSMAVGFINNGKVRHS